MASNAERDREEEQWLPVETGRHGLVVDAQTKAVNFPAAVEDEGIHSGFGVDKPGRVTRLWFRLGLWLDRPMLFVRRNLRVEQEAGGGFLWLPVWFGAGCVAYFNLPREPMELAFATVCLLACGFALWLGPGRKVYTALMVLAVFCAGASTAQWRTGVVATPMLSRTIVTEIKGRVVRAEYRADGSARYTVENHTGSSSGKSQRNSVALPPKIRLTARKGGQQFDVGQGIAGRGLQEHLDKTGAIPPSGDDLA